MPKGGFVYIVTNVTHSTLYTAISGSALYQVGDEAFITISV